MPHSGGGGSHGGGSHGGSHGGSSHRTSHTYFPGARRYRRHYSDGRPDEYFYTNGRPQKTTLSSIAFMGIFGVVFTALMGMGMGTSIPKKLHEEYDRPDTRVYDDAGVIADEDELEEVLEEYNDTTGICPIIYTIYTEDYEEEYADLETYAYCKYVDNYSDEQHYVVVYAIPQDQVEPFLSRELEVPDFEFEVMMGDETDPIMTESIESTFIHNVQRNLDNGCEVGETFTSVFEAIEKKCDRELNSPFRFFKLMPILIVVLFFAIPIVAMIKQYRKDQNMEFEEVPLADDDVKTGSTSGQSVEAMIAGGGPAVKVATAISGVFIGIFVIIGLSILFGGIVTLAGGSKMGLFMIGFGALWVFITLASFISTMRNLRKRAREQNPLTAEYPKAEMPHAEVQHAEVPHADYPSADYPEQADTSDQQDSFFGSILNRTSSYDDDDDDLRRKGYE